jgi:hypothetical protein
MKYICSFIILLSFNDFFNEPINKANKAVMGFTIALFDTSYDTIKILPGETKQIYFYVNLDGRLYYKIQNKSGTNKVKAWWIKGPFGSVEGISDLVGTGNIPFKGLLWGRLKVSNADSETMIYVTEEAQVANNFPTIHF